MTNKQPSNAILALPVQGERRDLLRTTSPVARIVSKHWSLTNQTNFKMAFSQESVTEASPYHPHDAGDNS